MELEAVSAIAAAASAVIAIGAAIAAKRSADRSGAAEERSARAAEQVAAIEEQRHRHELEDRAEARAPKLDLGARHGILWSLSHGALMGVIENHGPTTAIVDRITLHGPDGPIDVEAETESWNGVLDAGVSEDLAVMWPFDGASPAPVVITVNYASANGDCRAELEFTLRRDGIGTNDQPLWQSAETGRRRV